MTELISKIYLYTHRISLLTDSETSEGEGSGREMGSDQFTEIGTSISKLSRPKRRGQKTMDHGSLYELYLVQTRGKRDKTA